MGETRVDLQHLLEDLRDAYPGALEETILTEIVANSLDSGATSICFDADPQRSTLTVVDDGSGMKRRDLARYHDIAASSKLRGEGIGFAGVGIKLGLLACHEVLTETRRASTHVATVWRLASRNRAPWKWVPAPGLVAEHGTGVRLTLHNPLSALLDGGFLEATLQRHYQPLLEAAFDEILVEHYPKGVRFVVNGSPMARHEARSSHAPLAIRMARKRKPSAVGYLFRESAPVPEERAGVAISTLGKVIKRGWDWLGVTPALPEQAGGLIEAPTLAGCLTLSKADFIRTGQRGMTYLAYRKAIQEAVSGQLAAWGDVRDKDEEARRRKTRPLERDLQTVLVDLARDFPLVASLVEKRPGGQRRLAIGRGEGGTGEALAVAEPTTIPAQEEEPAAAGTEPPASTETAPTEAPAPVEPSRASPAEATTLPGGGGPKRPGRYGLSIQFENRPDDAELGRLVESTVWVNESHPAYRRAAASRSEGYHIALSVAMALAPLAAEPHAAQAFLTTFLSRWGEALEGPGRRRRRGA